MGIRGKGWQELPFLMVAVSSLKLQTALPGSFGDEGGQEVPAPCGGHPTGNCGALDSGVGPEDAVLYLRRAGEKLT